VERVSPPILRRHGQSTVLGLMMRSTWSAEPGIAAAEHLHQPSAAASAQQKPPLSRAAASSG
jgi:hypothetical protein